MASLETTVKGAPPHGGAGNPTAACAAGMITGIVALAGAVEASIAEARSPQPKCPGGYSETERALFRQLTESTGANICDSGFPGGRRWERNRRVQDFRSLPYGAIDPYYGLEEPVVTVSTFHCLRYNLEYDAGTTRRFRRFAKQRNPDGALAWLEVAGEFAERIDPEYEYYSSYNDEYSVLDQDIQFVGFDGDRILLQIHNGADARAGYTAPVAYSVSDLDVLETALQTWRASCSCDAGADGNGNGNGSGNGWTDPLHMELMRGEYDDTGLQSWPRRWKASSDGTARCDACKSAVSFG